MTGDERPNDEFRDFVLARGAALQRTAYLLSGDWALAEDMVQAALAKAFLSWERIRVMDQPEAYVRRVMINQRISWWRRRRFQDLPLDVIADPVSSDSLVPEDRDPLRRALLMLGQRQRSAVVLRFYCDLSESDVAAEMGCSIGNVKSLTSRGLDRLRQVLADGDTTEGLHA